MFFQNVDKIKVFYVLGDIDIDQFLNNDYFNMCISINDFIKVKSIKRTKELDLMDIFFEINEQRQGDLSVPIRLLRDSDQSDLYDLANVIEEYYLNLQKKKKSTKKVKPFKSEQQNQEVPNELNCDEFDGQNFDKSLQKAQKVIEDLKKEMKDQKHHFSYVVYKGKQYDQVRYWL
ncbi:hypothetical protein ABPG72_022094 [Tetrahymena utriculariae]